MQVEPNSIKSLPMSYKAVVTKNKVVRFNLTIWESGRLWMTYLGYSIQSGLKRSGWNLTNLTSGYGPAFNVLVWCNSKYYWLSQCFPTFFNSCTPWCLKIWWCTPRTYLSLEDSIDPDSQCNHDDKMAIKTDQSLLNDNKYESIQTHRTK